MKLSEAKAKSRNPQAFHHLDKWMVKNSVTGEPIEGAFTQSLAVSAADILNDHEARNFRPEVYVAEALDTE